MSFRYKRAVPSAINKALKRKSINAAFISSIESKKSKCANLGIIADGRVYSVLLLRGEQKSDPASASSNHLAHVLGLSGEVLIGDAALKYYLSGGEAIDLADEWKKKTGLPFVFARLCYNGYDEYIKKLSTNFIKSKPKIPQYILKKESKKRGISPKELSWYLEHIYYEIGYREKRALRLFLKN